MNRTPEDPSLPEEDAPQNHAVPAWKIAIIAVVVIGGIVAGSFLALAKSEKDLRLRGKPAGALGHDVVDNAPPGMEWIPGRKFLLGRDDGPDDERPAHPVAVRGFWIDRTEVTNEEFGRFVAGTGHVTVAEKGGTNTHTWRQPDGPGSNLDGRENHPVVWVAWADAVAFAQWAGKRLPSEAEWELAAQGARFGPRIMQFGGTVAVDSMLRDDNGLRGMDGNVREWCYDVYDPGFYAKSPGDNPFGPDDEGSFSETLERAIRGGLRASERGHAPAGEARPDTGFRLVKNGPPYGRAR